MISGISLNLNGMEKLVWKINEISKAETRVGGTSIFDGIWEDEAD